MTAQEILDALREIRDAPQAVAVEYENYRRLNPQGSLMMKHMASWARAERAQVVLQRLLLNIPYSAEELQDFRLFCWHRQVRDATDEAASVFSNGEAKPVGSEWEPLYEKVRR